MLEQWITVAKITTVFGIKGWVKIHSYTQPQNKLFSYTDLRLYMPQTQHSQAIAFDDFKSHGKGFIAHIDHCDDRNEALKYIKHDIQVRYDQLEQLPVDEFYWHQLEGLTAWVVSKTDEKTQHQCIGEVSHLIATGANDVLVIKPSMTSIDQRERLIPYIDQVVVSVSLEQGLIELDWDVSF